MFYISLFITDGQNIDQVIYDFFFLVPMRVWNFPCHWDHFGLKGRRQIKIKNSLFFKQKFLQGMHIFLFSMNNVIYKGEKK